MEHLVGIAGKDFVVIAADKSVNVSVARIHHDDDKILNLDNHRMFAAVGPKGDTAQFSEYLEKNMKLYSLRNGVDLRTESVAHWARKELATALRKGPYQVDSLIGGVDQNKGGSLFTLDYLGSMQKVPFGAHGYGGFFVLSILDRHYKPDLSLDQAVELLKMCAAEIKHRFLAPPAGFIVKAVTQEGVKRLEDI